jgi:hypothetical protein
MSYSPLASSKKHIRHHLFINIQIMLAQLFDCGLLIAFKKAGNTYYQPSHFIKPEI